VQTTLFFESLEERAEDGHEMGALCTHEQIYARAFRSFRPRTPVPEITIQFRKYVAPTSKIRLEAGRITVHISDLLEGAPAAIHEALACILLAKLFRRTPERATVARYNRYLNSAEMRRILSLVRQQRGRKRFRGPAGRAFDLTILFEDLNAKYFSGLMGRPELGWSVGASRTTLGHYDPSHNMIVLSSVLDSPDAPELVVRYVMFHEMLHLRFPTEYRRAARCIHTKAFREAERTFEGYAAAKDQLRRYLERVGAR